jgi:CPA2 family monovalent cation:H+ antiporter-2
MPSTIVYDLIIILAAGLLAGIACRWLHVSVLVGYLAVGALLGEGVIGLVRDESHEIEAIAEAGVFLLLFSIGMEFSLNELVRLGHNLIIGGFMQMLLTAAPIAGILCALGMAWQPAVLIASAASFSSTVLIFKVLTEWGHSSMPHGRRAIGILLFQDVALVPLLLLVPLLTGDANTAGVDQYVILAGTSVLFVGVVVLARYALPRWIIPLLAGFRSPELVALFTIVSLGVVTLIAYEVGLPPAIGAFAAGLIFSDNQWTKQVAALLLPFRETFATVFFVSLGLLFAPGLLAERPGFALCAFLACIVIKAAVATLALRITGLKWKAATGMGIGLAHVGEFAFVLLLLGAEAGVVPKDDYRMIVTLAIGSLILTPLLLKTGLRWIRHADEEDAHHRPGGRDDHESQAVVIGAGLIGCSITSRLETTGHDVCLVDLNPINLHDFAQLGVRTVAGDATDVEILTLASTEEAAMVIICVPDDDTAMRTMRSVRNLNKAAFVLVRCRYRANAKRIMDAGADQVIDEESQVNQKILRVLDAFEEVVPRGPE